MTPKQAALKLRKTMTLQAIGEAVSCSITTVYDIAAGKDCRWSLGDRLIRLASKPAKAARKRA